MGAAFVLCDGLLSVVMIVMIWKRMLPLKNTAQRVLAPLCNPLLSDGVIGNLSALLPWPLNQFDNGSESLGHALVLVLGLILLKIVTSLTAIFYKPVSSSRYRSFIRKKVLPP